MADFRKPATFASLSLLAHWHHSMNQAVRCGKSASARLLFLTAACATSVGFSAHSSDLLDRPVNNSAISEIEEACLEQNRVYIATQQVRIKQETLLKPDRSSYQSPPVETMEELDKLCESPKDSAPNVDTVNKVADEFPRTEKPIPLSEYAAFEEKIEQSRRCLELGCRVPDNESQDAGPPKIEVYPAFE